MGARLVFAGADSVMLMAGAMQRTSFLRGCL
jgi:hypothetical protein